LQQLVKTATADLLIKQQGRLDDARQFEEERGALHQNWIDAMADATEIQEDCAAEVARNHVEISKLQKQLRVAEQALDASRREAENIAHRAEDTAAEHRRSSEDKDRQISSLRTQLSQLGQEKCAVVSKLGQEGTELRRKFAEQVSSLEQELGVATRRLEEERASSQELLQDRSRQLAEARKQIHDMDQEQAAASQRAEQENSALREQWQVERANAEQERKTLLYRLDQEAEERAALQKQLREMTSQPRQSPRPRDPTAMTEDTDDAAQPSENAKIVARFSARAATLRRNLEEAVAGSAEATAHRAVRLSGLEAEAEELSRKWSMQTPEEAPATEATAPENGLTTGRVDLIANMVSIQTPQPAMPSVSEVAPPTVHVQLAAHVRGLFEGGSTPGATTQAKCMSQDRLDIHNADISGLSNSTQ
jgi:hypothetical protein